ncbi:hypothetical protein BSR29_00020 [Boudabousia liubingyangii]|uniref:Isopeptide-forming domain-containing fimbrial protein n=1 Tax=Boudabousia liubingyangii TaxID=1921764 RepID=A0A1Q5PPM6_9ACTO|nr:SpaH/EbpB family LPXTG-anchored major pilin [Boudabousia liubingyangii]OKL49400.1 hypothetical protein BSR29_00020 [Boudabousia liubingyangii]
MSKNIRKAAAGFTVAAVALTGFSAQMAMAAPGDEVAQAAPASTITKETGSIKITKLTPSSAAQTNGDGTKLAENPTGSQPIQGVTFTAYMLEGLNLKTNEGWAKAAELAKTKPAIVKAEDGSMTVGGYKLVQKGTGKTGAAGTLDLASLPVGLYVVVEDVTGKVVIKGDTEAKDKTVEASQVLKADPFFVSVPMTNPANRTEWMYDIHVYPKNTTTKAPVKSLNDDANGKGAGNAAAKSEILYTLSAEVPAAKLNQFMLVDRYKDAQLDWVGADTDTVKIGDTKLDADDFKLTQSTAAVGEYRYVTMELTASGLAKLEGKTGQNVTWEFHAKVKQTAAGEEIPNKVFEIANPDNEGFNQWNPEDPTNPNPNLPEQPVDPKNPEGPKKPKKPFVPTTPESPNPGGSTPGNEVKSYYGKVVINKKGSDNVAKLNGAEFELYQCNPANGYELGEKISVNGKEKWISGTDGAEGQITISGLLVNDFRNNSEFVNGKDGATWAEQTAYCLKETKAPEGYELLPETIHFQVKKADATAKGKVELDVTNVKKNGGFNLPVTGGAGIATLVTAGVLLLAGSGAYVLAASRKREQA